MPKNAIIITIPKPCSENWEEMSAADRGRFCAVCQKTVIDFSALSDAEVVRITKSESVGGGLCGRYHHSQLGREMISYEPRYTFGGGIIKKIAASLLLLQTAVSSAHAQRAHAKTSQHTKTGKESDKTVIKRQIKGCVTDIVTQKPLPDMLITVAGTDIKAITDMQGNFRFQLPDSIISATIKLKATYTEKSGAEPGWTTILEEELKVDSSLFIRDIILYRYPINVLDNAVVATYRKEIVNIRYSSGGAIAECMLIPKPTRVHFWNRWFSKKHKNDE